MNSQITLLESNIGKALLGKADKIRLAVVTLLADEHLLIEDVPGVGKTLLGRALARSIDGEFKRIQFTPDLLPSDITGAEVYNTATGEFAFQPGPIFANIVLADEINRTTPRTQSAALEAMEENQVTSNRKTYPLERPFMVIATQNPQEFEGAYPLPESQLDRFLMRISLGYPNREMELDILKTHQIANRVESLTPVLTASDVVAMQNEVCNVTVDDSLQNYILDIVSATRELETLRLGVSPRGALALYRAAQSWAFCDGRNYCIPDDVRSLAVPVLAHRIIPKGCLQENRRQIAERIIESILEQIAVPG